MHSKLKKQTYLLRKCSNCTRLTNADDLLVEYNEVELFWIHEEADTKIILHMIRVSHNAPKNLKIINYEITRH